MKFNFYIHSFFPDIDTFLMNALFYFLRGKKEKYIFVSVCGIFGTGNYYVSHLFPDVLVVAQFVD